MTHKQDPHGPLQAMSKRGFRGYPIATVAFYGPDDLRASKIAVGIVADESGEVTALRRWSTVHTDVRFEPLIATEIQHYIQSQAVRTVVMSDSIIGCPHEEGVDYPDGQSCPQCPYWAGRNRFTGEHVQ